MTGLASDGYSAPFRAALERAAKAAGAVVVPSPTTPTPSTLALAENQGQEPAQRHERCRV